MADFRDLLSFNDELHSFSGIGKEHLFRDSSRILYSNGFAMSVAANALVYCYPRITTDIYEYKSLEIAFMDYKNKFRFMDLNKHHDFQNFKSLYKIQRFFNGDVYAYIPIRLIQELFDYIETIYNRIDISTPKKD